MTTTIYVFTVFIVLLLAIFSLSEKKESSIVVVAHCNENLEWIKNVNIKCKVISRNGIEKERQPNKGNEASIYLEYIIEHYYLLTDYTIFVHGHRTDWHHK